jgi:hypothetical protein
MSQFIFEAMAGIHLAAPQDFGYLKQSQPVVAL